MRRVGRLSTVRGPDAVLLRRTGLRIGLQAAGLVSVIVVVLTATAVAVLLHSQRVGATTLLEEANARAIDVLDPPVGVYLIARTTDGRIVTTPGLPPDLADTSALRRTATTGHAEAFDLHTDHRSYTARTVRRGDGVTLEAILDLSTNHGERDRLLTAMLISGTVGLALAAAAGAWLGARATRPLSTALALQHRFISDASHELRTPLTLLSTRAQLLRRRLRGTDLASDVSDTADRVVTDARRLAAILDDLLVAANPNTGQPHTLVDLVDLATDVVAEAQLSPVSRIIITGPTVDEATQKPRQSDVTTVLGSPIALRRSITALIDNATRHAHTAVDISVRRVRRHVLLEVADDGPGVDPELTNRLFERFASTRTPGPDGRRHYGLGLALVSEIVAAHRGKVELVDPEVPGSTFRITLPLAPRSSRTNIVRL